LGCPKTAGRGDSWKRYDNKTHLVEEGKGIRNPNGQTGVGKRVNFDLVEG